ncbi:ABC transporter permease [Polaribacter sargassicola]|uniref:ABC transporter permease n=1 Tax=Polaribacter sargassicola TaxID=2836891 RepID=UPI001F3B9493|nr:ABC transporter permease [Polaribacter sp. DS7-9]MCG1037199.1 ABC transporter permease [Polaribacter sp. DS7-9]
MSKMKPSLRIAKREIALLFNTKSTFVLAIILPFVFILFFNSLLSKGVARDLPVAVVDLDQSATSRNIIAQLDAAPEIEIGFFPVNQQKGEELIRLGKVYGLVTIPKNIEADLKSGKQVTIVNQYNSNLLLAGGLENKAFRKVIGTISAGINIEKQRKQGVSKQQAIINYVPIIANNHTLSNPYTNYSYYLNTGFLTMFLQLFVMLTTIYCFGADLKYSKGGKLLNITKGSLLTIILGKVLPYTVWFFLVGIVTLLSMYVWQDFPFFGSKLTVLAGLLLLIVANQCYALYFVSVSNSFREALTFGSGFAAVSLSFSGVTYPIFGMPTVLQWLSQIFPFTHFFELLLDQSQRGFPVFYSLKSIIILVVLSIVSISLSWFKLKRLFLKGSFNHNI